ncbi:MAG: hypothetical protein ACHQEM_07150 [Chitinophagales bacterium]
MRYFLSFILLLVYATINAQGPCPKNSILYKFYKDLQPRPFNQRLGNHPEFPFLQTRNGITTVDSFLRSIKNPENQTNYAREFKAFDLLLRNSGFVHGYKDLNSKNIVNTHVPMGTIGNLGFYDPVRDLISYIYVTLSPAGEDPEGVKAWKLTNANGCWLYILHTCGNAFYPNEHPGFNSDSTKGKSRRGVAVVAAGSRNKNNCCRTVSVEPYAEPLAIHPDTVDKQVTVTVNIYQGRIAKVKRNYDTVYSLIKRRDSIFKYKDVEGRSLMVHMIPHLATLMLCKDSTYRPLVQFSMENAHMSQHNDTIALILADTVYASDSVLKSTCNTKWEIAVDGGFSFNSVPRLSLNTIHTQTNGRQMFGEFAIGRILNRWLMMGVSASYVILSYQDDNNYAGSIPATYNTIYFGKPVIPIQLFGKATIGKEVGWQSTVSISAGYAFQQNAQIQNSAGTNLNIAPDYKSGFTGGFKLGVAHFFTCHFGMGLSFNWQYFSNTGSLINYNPHVLELMGGLKIRF